MSGRKRLTARQKLEIEIEMDGWMMGTEKLKSSRVRHSTCLTREGKRVNTACHVHDDSFLSTIV